MAAAASADGVRLANLDAEVYDVPQYLSPVPPLSRWPSQLHVPLLS